MGYHPRIEDPKLANLLTTRTVDSRLWFINNKPLEEAILSFVAKYAARYKVRLYAIAIQGNHIQGPALFPENRRSDFMRDLNSSVARSLPKFTAHLGGKAWGRRYSNEFLPSPADIEEYFFYTVLQPVKDSLVPKISQYPGYNCFHDAVWGRKKKYKVVKWGEYNKALKRDPTVKISDYTEIVVLQYERLPGYEHLTQKEYAHLMMGKLEARRQKIVADRYASGKGFVGEEALRATVPGTLPFNTKTSTINDHRPRILSICPKLRREYKDWYFDYYFRYKDCSLRYREGESGVVFPLGTYPPNLPCAVRQ